MRLPIPDDWNGTDWCRFSICWPNSLQWRGILRGFITLPQRGWTWDEKTGELMGVIAVGREIADLNIDLEECIMACGDTGLQEIANALIKISLAMEAQANASANCSAMGGCGSAGAPNTAPQPTQITEGNPNSDPPPLGFESWTEFFAYKCAVATHIVDTLIGDVNRMTTLNIIGLTIVSMGAALLPVLLTPVPFDDILAIAGILIASIALGTALLDSISDTLSAARSDLICALFNSSSAEQAEQEFQAEFNEAYDNAGYGEPLAFSAKALIANMVGPAALNKLFDRDTTRNWSGGDCSNCPEMEWRFANWGTAQNPAYGGTLVSGSMDANTDGFVAESVLNVSPIDPPCGGQYSIAIEAPGGQPKRVTIDINGWTDSGCGADYSYNDESGMPHNFDGDPNTTFNSPVCLTSFFIRGGATFTVEVTVIEDCP